MTENESLVQRFLARYASPRTRDAYAHDLQQFLRFIGKPLPQITTQDIGAFASWLTFAEWHRPTAPAPPAPAPEPPAAPPEPPAAPPDRPGVPPEPPGSQGPYSATTVMRKLDSVRRFLRWLIAEGLSHIPEHELAAATATDRSEYNAARRERRRHRQRTT